MTVLANTEKIINLIINGSHEGTTDHNHHALRSGSYRDIRSLEHFASRYEIVHMLTYKQC